MLTLNNKPFPDIETSRLQLRRITLSDKEDFFNIRSHPDVNRYIDRPVMKEMHEAIEFITKVNNSVDVNEIMSWGITLKGSHRLVGTIDFWKITFEHYRAEIGYVLHPDFHKQGIMSEAMTAVLHHGFYKMKFHSVEANINPDNTASKKLLLKHGFVKEAYFRENYFYNGKFLDSEIYSLITKG